jgi:hypothetical protein
MYANGIGKDTCSIEIEYTVHVIEKLVVRGVRNAQKLTPRNENTGLGKLPRAIVFLNYRVRFSKIAGFLGNLP